MSFVIVAALQKRLGMRLEDALLDMLKKKMTVTEISNRLVISRATIYTLIDYLDYHDHVSTVADRRKAKRTMQ